MKIYFDGCSWTWGDELEDRKRERYSALLCDQLGAVEGNFSKCGGSNDRIVRNLLVKNNIEDYDLAVIQMTYPARTEYVSKDKWEKVSAKFNYTKWLNEGTGDISRIREKFPKHKDFWKYYYLEIATKLYFDTKEKIHFETIKAYCKSKNVPLILCTLNNWSKLKFDLYMDRMHLKKHRYSHPTKESHQKIAERILIKWKNLK
tara:strand:- start:1091 stop:1699 length:609 start_codon:yes stop_codon:yes gene_type:complete